MQIVNFKRIDAIMSTIVRDYVYNHVYLSIFMINEAKNGQIILTLEEVIKRQLKNS